MSRIKRVESNISMPRTASGGDNVEWIVGAATQVTVVVACLWFKWGTGFRPRAEVYGPGGPLGGPVDSPIRAC